jgi:nicotinate-nucleotide adenylyltransferase
MRIALFGGTFDPVHNGHLLLAEAARTTHRLDRVIFIPTGVPPHKAAATAASSDRLKMLRLAIAGNPAFQVSDWEIRQRRVVYSYETIEHFKQTSARASLFFIVGTDMLATIHLWKQGQRLLSECTFLGAERPETPWKKLPAAVRRLAKPIEWPAVPFASHEIRQQVRKRRSVRYQIPDAVERYIRKRRLYR